MRSMVKTQAGYSDGADYPDLARQHVDPDRTDTRA